MEDKTHNLLKLKEWADTYLSNEEYGKELSTLAKHPSWFVIPELLQLLLDKARNELEVCKPDQIVFWQAQCFALRQLIDVMRGSVATALRSARIRNQGGIYGRQHIKETVKVP